MQQDGFLADPILDGSFDRFFYEKTHLFYDFVVSDIDEPLTGALPCVEWIEKQIPNTSGYSTGMEDSMLTGGIVLDMLTTMATKAKGDKKAKYSALAEKVFDGLSHCADCAYSAGFLPRSVSPIDGKSHYVNSSRDQYTNFIFGMYRFFRSTLSDDRQKATVIRQLTAIAEKAEREVVPENGYELLRDDGRHGINCVMWGDTLGAHEWMRLPMIYAAAYAVSGDEHWKTRYLSYRDKALERSADVNPKQFWHTYAGLQMQYSLVLCFEIDEEEAFRVACGKVIEKLGTYYQPVAVKAALALANPCHAEELRHRYVSWQKVKAGFMGVQGGYACYNPWQASDDMDKAHYPIRDVGDAARIAALAGFFDEKLQTALETLLGSFDWSLFNSNSILDLLAGYCAGAAR